MSAADLREILTPVALERACGDCRACCKTHGIYETGKNRGVWCEHACSRGCAIYATRPASCAEFVCLWLYGGPPFEEADRPDKTKLVFEFQGTKVFHMRTGFSRRQVFDLLLANELDDHAADRPRGQDLIRRVLALGAAVAIKGATRMRELRYPDGYVHVFPKDDPDGALEPTETEIAELKRRYGPGIMEARK